MNEKRTNGEESRSMSRPSRVLPSLEDAAAFADGLRRNGRRVVFTNGVFDLLHPGHVRYLRAARAEGDALIVAVNSDRSVRANKGPARPIVPQHERAELVAALGCVDAAFVFDEDTPDRVIRAVRPDVLVKGADWAHDAIVGRDVVEGLGGRVVRAPIEPGYSTTEIVKKVKQVKKG
jgi:D-beta-D-heptose 7-phosphate kinase/D-beta-D-heptose 1-phosphate adenosyltransferase